MDDGSILGPTIAKSIANLLGGKLSFSTDSSGISTFSLTVPVSFSNGYSSADIAEIQERKEPSENDFETSSETFSGKILLVEDEPSNQTVMSLLLETMGFEVKTASDGAEGVDAAESETFDLIFMDIRMPNMDGYEAVKILREKGINIPVVALTAHDIDDSKEKFEQSGFSGYLHKPVGNRKLKKAVKKYLPNANASEETGICGAIDSLGDLGK